MHEHDPRAIDHELREMRAQLATLQDALSFSQRDHDVLGEQVQSLQRVVLTLQQRLLSLEAGAERIDRLLRSAEGGTAGEQSSAEDQ